MLNKAIIMGRLVRDPELRRTPSNIPVTSITVAVERDRKTDGQPTTDFIDVVVWNKTAEFVSQWFSKGAMIIVTGRIQTRNWEDKNGNKRVSVEIVADVVHFGESKKSRDSYNQNQSSGYNAPAPSYDLPTGDSDFSELADDDGEVPF